MKSPLWMFNIGLLFVFLISFGFIFFTKKSIPLRRAINYKGGGRFVVPREIPAVDLERIYKNDLFQTYQEAEPTEPVTTIPTISLEPPVPPALKQPQLVLPAKMQFIDPLKVELSGIITDSVNANSNRAIINNKLYAAGEMVEDAEILKIYRNKVAFLRSNGQMETIFLRSAEATSDQTQESKISWEDVVYKIDDNKFAIDPQEIKTRFINAAQFIDSLNLTTAIFQDVAIGSRIGVMSPDAIGKAIGLRYGDIILTVNDMPVKTTKDRIEVYKIIQDLASKDEEATIRVKLVRNQGQVEIDFVLKSIDDFLNQ
jgi:type II secretory pathway component PulC